MKTEQPILIDSGQALEASGLVHRVWEPDTDGPHPTIVMLQGRSGNEDVTWVFARTLPKEWLIVTPRALYEDPRGGYSWDLKPSGDWPDTASFDPGVDKLETFLTALPQLYNADPDQLYLLGFSQGAAVSYCYIMRHANRVRAMAGLVGLMPTDALTQDGLSHFEDLPVFMAMGRKDDTVPPQISADCAQALIAGGARLDYRGYSTGHKLNGRGMRDLAAWWAQQAALASA